MRNILETRLYPVIIKIKKQVHLHNLSYEEYVGNRVISSQSNDLKPVHLHNLCMRTILESMLYLVRLNIKKTGPPA